MRARPLLTGLIAATLTAGVTVAFPAVARPTHPHATFSRPMILAGGGAEPSIRVPADGRSVAYVSAPTGLGSNFWRITRKRWPDGAVSFMQSPVQQPDAGTGGGGPGDSGREVTHASPAHSCAP